MFGAIKDFLTGVNYEEEEYMEDMYDDYEEEREQRPAPTITPRFTKSEEDSKILNFNSGTNPPIGLRLMVVRTSDDSLMVVNNIQDNKACIIKVESSEERSEQNHVDFINGAVYALAGHVEKINEDMIIATPKSFDIRGSFFEEVKSQSNSFFRIMGGKR